jgi:preprotein translocase subunit SecG
MPDVPPKTTAFLPVMFMVMSLTLANVMTTQF